MEQAVHLWIEDMEGKSSFIFWKTMMNELFPSMVVESKKNNSELVKAVKNIHDDDIYLVVMDNSFDNPNVFREQKKLKEYSKGKNVFSLNFICFEFLLLEFEHLLDWIYAPEDDFRKTRADAIDARNALIRTISNGDMNYKNANEIARYDANLNNRNIEQLSAKLLYDLTRNTGFEVSKKAIGECWVSECCKWTNRQDDDICGLDNGRLSVQEKMQSIYSNTSIHQEFHAIGLEAGQ